MATHPDYPGVSSRVVRGKTSWRYRAPGKRGKAVTLPGKPGDEEFAEAYAQATRKRSVADILNMPGRALPRTYGKAARLLEASQRWMKYGKSTQYQYARHLEKLMNARVIADVDLNWRDTPIEGTPPKALRDYVLAIYQFEPFAGREVLRAIKAVVEMAIEAQWIEPEDDPTLSIKLAKPKHKPQPKWPDNICAMFEARHPIGTPARTAYALGKYSGSRRGDVAELGWDQLTEVETETDDEITYELIFDFNQQKNRLKNGGKHMQLPVPKPLLDVLNHLGRQPGKTILQRLDGEPYSIKSLTGTMRKWCEQAGIPEGYTMHGLRRTYAHDLAKAKAPVTVIRDMMGHDDIGTTQIYLDEVNQLESAIEARELLDRRIRQKEAALARKAAGGSNVIRIRG